MLGEESSAASVDGAAMNKKPYRKPELSQYGKVSALTSSTSNGQMEMGTGFFNDFFNAFFRRP